MVFTFIGFQLSFIFMGRIGIRFPDIWDIDAKELRIIFQLLAGLSFGILGKLLYHKAINDEIYDEIIERLLRLLIGIVVGFYTGAYAFFLPLRLLVPDFFNSTNDGIVSFFVKFFLLAPIFICAFFTGLIGLFLGIPWANKAPFFKSKIKNNKPFLFY